MERRVLEAGEAGSSRLQSRTPSSASSSGGAVVKNLLADAGDAGDVG